MITNEGMPFRKPDPLPCLHYALSWSIEHVGHGFRFLPITDVFFCDDPIMAKVQDFNKYPKMKVVYDEHPKYLCLNKSREEMCKMLGISHKNKYVLVMGPAPSLKLGLKQKNIQKMVKFFSRNGFKILYKYKKKDKSTNIYRDIEMANALSMKYSAVVLLLAISELSIGFNTGGIVEAIHTNTPYINYYLDCYVSGKFVDYRKHWQFKINNEFVLRLDRFDADRVNKFLDGLGKEKRTHFPLAKELDL